jgi:hypothetical protein
MYMYIVAKNIDIANNDAELMTPDSSAAQLRNANSGFCVTAGQRLLRQLRHPYRLVNVVTTSSQFT